MAVICPAITAEDADSYNQQVHKAASVSKRLHIDLMNGSMTPNSSVGIRDIWWPHHVKADIHLMYDRPEDVFDELVRLKPHMVILQNESSVHHMYFAARLHSLGIKAGLSILQSTPIEWAQQIMHSFDQVLIFSGNLGYHGGSADLELLSKVRFVREVHPEAEIAWDGGVNSSNVKQLVEGGVNVLDIGGFLMNDPDIKDAYGKIKKSLEKHQK